jgi:signal transduction histidine kinase/CheY-like chemotaxis protein
MGAGTATPEQLPRGRAFILLRYTLIVATAYLILVEGEFRLPPLLVVAVIVAALASNVVATLLPPSVLASALFNTVVVVGDTIWISVALAASGRFAADFFYLYFFVLLLAAIGENLTLIVVGAVAVCGAYLYVLSLNGGAWFWGSPSLIRLPFIFTAGAFYGYLIDHTRREERAAATAETAAVAKSSFLAVVSHEIRTPMSAVVGWTNLLLDSRLTADQREFAEGIRRSAEALGRMVDDILDFSKIEAGRIELETIPFSPRDVVADVMELLAGGARQKGIELCYHVDPAVPESLRGDPGRLRQVLVNLVANAIKFTAQGEVVVRARLVRQGARGVVVSVEVADTGVGITAEQRARLFQPFAQGDRSTARKFGGTGLGLAISKQLVTLMGGEIGVTSEPESGTTFWFTVRLAADGSRTGASMRASPSGLRTLVVDDNPAARAILEQELRGWGVRTNGADDGATALARLERGVDQEDPYAVAVVDADMPGDGGLELVRAIAAAPRLRMLPVVLLTTPGQRDAAVGGAPGNVIATVPKPVNGRRLRDAVAMATAQAWPAVSAGLSARRSPRAAGS